MKEYISKLALVVALSATTSGCGIIINGLGNLFSSPMKREERDVNYVIEKGVTIEQFEGSSDYTVVLIPDNHKSYGCAANVYLTLESLVDKTRFVAREERVGPTEHTNKDFQEHRYYDSQLKTKYYRNILSLPFEERKELARQWIEERKFPSEYSFMRGWEATDPMIPPVLLEAVYQEKVQTIGVEDQDSWAKAKAFHDPSSKTYIEDEEDLRTEENLKIQFDDRNLRMVERIEHYAAEIKSGELVPFVVGAGHVKHPFDPKNKMTLRAILKRKNISYKVIEHEPCKIPVKN